MGSDISPLPALQSHACSCQQGRDPIPRDSINTLTPYSRSDHGSHKNATSTGVEAMSDGNEQPVARHTPAVADIESQAGNARFRDSDPFDLSSRLKTAEQLNEIKANTARKRTNLSGANVAKFAPSFKARKVHTFYHEQNERIQRLLKSVDEHRADHEQEQGDDHLRYQIAVWGSFAANVCLAILQVYAAISSGSLSLFTTMADSIFDPLSNLQLIVLNQAKKRVDPNRFPSGKIRLETVGNITFCFMMITVGAILVAFSCQDISNRFGTSDTVNDFHLPSVIAVCVAFTTKLSLFLFCWHLKHKYSQVEILWKDHRNDLLINGFGILTSVGGSKLAWWIDPTGAIVLSLVIIGIWLGDAYEQFMLLVGKAAPVEIQQLITYICLTYHPSIVGIDTVRVYHSGPKLLAEIDIVMDPEETLRVTHDVSQSLQDELEKLPDVERAFVHVDWETDHKPEHSSKKDL
ncbi:hypothetical protein F4821DRAFT_74713 [Hypoxylon rubiginosum]|uniref:Uncharacterized protein n=1 Tax=Hypoxylon rubiginosum TaxID=110542 RepID=A0ACC0DKJ7_9PEZI|nr:hypothetical protein F4821DRAFT_74713 [Hypoxylon rubiginosum]